MVPSVLSPNRTVRPSGLVTTTLPVPSLSGTAAMSYAVDQPAPNKPVVRGSSELYERVIANAGPATATFASVAEVV